MRLRIGRGIPPREVHRPLFDWIPSEDQRTNERCMSWGTLDATLRFLGAEDWWEAKRAWCKRNRSTHFEIVEGDALLIEQAVLAFRAANPGVPVRFMSDEEDRELPYTYDDYRDRAHELPELACGFLVRAEWLAFWMRYAVSGKGKASIDAR